MPDSTLTLDRSTVWHPYTQMKLAPAPVAIARAEGAWLYGEDGKKYLDAISSWWVTLHGHAHPHIAAAIGRQAAQLEQVIFAGFTHRPAAELAAKLVEILPAGLTRVFYSDNGSTAVEVALKMAVQYWRNQGHPERCRFIALEHAYHGDTVGTMSVSEASYFTDPFEKLLFPVHRAHTAWCYRCPVGLTRDRCSIDCLQSLEATLRTNGDEIAAVIVEPLLQGVGGMIVQPVEFLRGVRQLCDRYGVLLIADEVLTGFGRTGTMFACEQAGISPDVICLSKGLTGGFLPMAVTACTEHIYAAFFSDDRRKTLFHGHSYTANPLGCAAGLASLEVFAQEDTMQRIRRIANQHRQRLDHLRRHPRVGEARQAGTVGVIELAEENADYLASIGPKLQQFYLEHGVLLRPLGSVLYVLPPYCIQEDELDQVWDVIEASLAL